MKELSTASKRTIEEKKKKKKKRGMDFLQPQTPHHGLTVHILLLLLGQDAGQVGTMQPTFPLRGVPRAPVGHVFVAVRLKLLPTESTNLRV